MEMRCAECCDVLVGDGGSRRQIQKTVGMAGETVKGTVEAKGSEIVDVVSRLVIAGKDPLSTGNHGT